MNNVNSIKLLQELEHQLKGIKGFYKKDNTQLLTLFDQLKSSINADFNDCQNIISNRKNILKNADILALNTIKKAEQNAQSLLESAEKTAKSMTESAQITARIDELTRAVLDKATANADILTKKTKDHLDSVFAEVEQYLLNIVSLLRTNREELRFAIAVGSVEKRQT
ncbi:MAG: hypothetical protein FWD86_02515 [Firmicutes bacterium]|nr:hypothetical protein [Bacillota bacterium]